MILKNLKTYFKILSKNKFYTFVSIFGFSVSLMFVILLSLYARQELSVDNFHEKKDRIYLMMHNKDTNFGNPVAERVKDNFPEVEAFVRVLSWSAVEGTNSEDRMITKALFADSTFFTVFSFPLIEGDPSKVLAGDKTVVLTESFLNRRFPNRDAIGKQIHIDGNPFIVTGIMKDIPHNTQFPKVDYVASYPNIQLFWDFPVIDREDNYGFTMYFLEKEGADLRAKEGEILKQLKENSWYYKSGYTNDLHFTKLQDAYFEVGSAGYIDMRTNSRTLITVYLAIAFVILIIATLNYISMTVAQSNFRGKEIGIKKLLGTSRSSVIGQILFESLFMTVITFSLGLLFAFFIKDIAAGLLTTQLELSVLFTPVGILILVAFVLFIAFVSGIIPALIISGFEPLAIVKGELSRKSKTVYSRILIVFQYTITIVLLICTFFIGKQSDFLVNYDVGFTKKNIYTYINTTQSRESLEGFRSKLLAIPGVENVSLSNGLPFEIMMNMLFDADGESKNIVKISIDDQFMSVYDINIKPVGTIAGNHIVYLSEYGVKYFNMDSTNFTVRLDNSEKYLVGGIFKEIHTKSLHSGKEPIGLFPLPNDWWASNISIKFSDNADVYKLAKQIDKEFSDYRGGVPIEGRFVDDVVQQWYDREQKLSKIIFAFTLLTIIISIMGVFAMSLYMIKQKEKEIGIRKVNGATGNQILWMLNKESLIRVLIGFVIACPIAYYTTTRWLEGFSYRISLNWWTFALAGAIISLLTLISVSYMTWKAAQTNPVKTLKSE